MAARLKRTLMLLTLGMLPGLALPYPLDGEPYTGIARLEGYRLAQEGKVYGTRQPPGGKLTLDQVDLRLVGVDIEVPPPDPEFSQDVADLMGTDDVYYAVAVLDLTNPAKPVYAEHRADTQFNPGSVGKIVVATALFQLLADLYPDDIAARERVLRSSRVVADDFIVYDSHDVPFWDGRRLSYRPLRQGDAASLWTYLDWMLSASSNAAGSMVMREVLLLAHFGRSYPVSEANIDAFFRTTPRSKLSTLLARTMDGALERNGLDTAALRQGSFFTRTGKARVPGRTSHASPRELTRWLLKLEGGQIVDVWSSREIKRLLYITQRRIRYASSPGLDEAAVYFKSGSLYRCRPEKDFVCGKYMGNVENLLNSVAIVEHPAGALQLHYMVVITSNKLRKNSAVAHQTLGTPLQRLLAERHHVAGRSVEHRFVHLDDQPAQPFAALGAFGQGDGDVAPAAAFDDGAVGMPVPPAAGLAKDPGVGAFLFEALDELVVNAGIAEESLHLARERGRDEAAAFQQVVEARDLQRGGAVREVVEGVAHGFAAAAIGPADPQSAVAGGVVEPVTGRLQLVGQVAHPDPVQHLGRGAVGRNADHAGEGFAGVGVELHVARLDAVEGPEQNGDLGQARGVDHVVGVERGEPGTVEIGNVGQRDRELSFAHGAVEAEALDLALELGLQAAVDGTVEFRKGRAGVNGN